MRIMLILFSNDNIIVINAVVAIKKKNKSVNENTSNTTKSIIHCSGITLGQNL